MREDHEVDEKKQAAADVLFNYSTFVMACIGNQTRPCDMRLHLMKEISGLPTSLKRREASRAAISPDPVGESSSSGTARLDKADSFRALCLTTMQKTLFLLYFSLLLDQFASAFTLRLSVAQKL